MAQEESEIYIARKQDGTLITVQEYAARQAGLNRPSPIFCPHCFSEADEEQPLTYDTEKCRFVHQRVWRDCYQDDRTTDRDHPLIQQTVFKQLKNDDQYSYTDIEFPLKRWNSCDQLSFDVGAILSEDTDLQGILVEVQHQSGTFSDRLYPRIKDAQKRNYGVYVVFSPSARYQQWFGKRLIKLKGLDARVGLYENGNVDLGTLIHPDDNISLLRTHSPRERGHVLG